MVRKYISLVILFSAGGWSGGGKNCWPKARIQVAATTNLAVRFHMELWTLAIKVTKRCWVCYQLVNAICSRVDLFSVHCFTGPLAVCCGHSPHFINNSSKYSLFHEGSKQSEQTHQQMLRYYSVHKQCQSFGGLLSWKPPKYSVNSWWYF